MEARAVAKDVKISADKARLVMNLIRGKNISEAMAILKNLNKKASRLIQKVVESSTANATNNLGLDQKKLFVKKAYVNEGAVLKRPMFDSRGHVGRKDKRTSHLTVVVSEKQ